MNQRFLRSIAAAALLAGIVPGIQAAAPNTLGYQGRLTQSGVPVNSAVTVTFKLYAVASGGAALWTENQTITPSNGLYSAILGQGVAFPAALFDQPLWLGVTLGSDPEMTPRQQLTSTPYSQQAKAATTATTATTASTATALSATPSTCAAGQYARGISANGNAVGCTAASGSLPSCSTGQVLKYSGSSWSCGTDLDTNSGGTVTSITAGNGLTGGIISTSGTIAVDPNSATLTGTFAKQGGNSFGTTAVLGTTDNQPLDIMVGNSRIMRYDPATRSVVGGHANNRATVNGTGAVIGGGGGMGSTCRDWQAQTDTRDCGNVADGVYNTIGGGYSNQVGHNASTVAGGWFNSATGQESTVGGGWNNRALHAWATVVGGVNNAASGIYSIILGGGNNEASGDHGIASGWCARASHRGSFVWADSMNYLDCHFASTAQNQFSVRATGGVRFVTAINTSSVPTKTFSIDSAGNATAEGTVVGQAGVRGETVDGIAVYGINTSTNWPAVEGWNKGTGDIIRAWAGPSGSQQLRLAANNNGNLWIAGTLTQASDGRLKTDVGPLPGALDKLTRLRGVRYLMKDSGDGTPHIGVIAQELEREYPELVATDEAGIKSVAYANLTAVLIEAVKTLKDENTELKSRLAAVEHSQRDELAALKRSLAELKESLNDGRAPGSPLALQGVR